MEKQLFDNFALSARRLWKPFVAVFVLSWIVINWSNISWVFNYEVAGQHIRGWFPKNPEIAGSGAPSFQIDKKTEGASTENGGENKDTEENVAAVEPDSPDESENENDEPAVPVAPKANTISIASINVKAPIVVANTTDNTVLHSLLDSGVVMYPDSAVPGSDGQTIILGHSAPAGWPNIKYDWVFTHINELRAGDRVTLNFNSAAYDYSVTKQIFLEKGEELPKNDGSGNTLFLISCWPPGKDVRRIAVQATLID